MITITIALSFYILYFLKRQDMTILTRQERERLVLDLYNQGKTYREIVKEARISQRDIGVILNKAVEEKKIEGSKEVQDNDSEKNQDEEQQLSLSTQSYKLFSEGKTPLEVAIVLNLRESEATEFYKEYWKLKQLHNLNMVYEEIKDDIEPLLKLFKLAKAKGLGVQQVVNLLAITNNDLPTIEERLKRLEKDVSKLQSQKHTCKRNLYQLNNQIATITRLLNSLRMSCERERREIEDLHNEKAKLESIVTQFKSSNEYLEIKQVAEEKVKDVLTNGKLLLNFATASVIESLRRNPELYNFVLSDISNNTDTTSCGSNGLSLMLPGQQRQQPFRYLNEDIFTVVILEESEEIYNKLTTKLTNEAMAAAAAIRGSSSLPLLPPSCNNNKQKLIYENDRYDETEEPRYNNNQS
jgi:FMN phosphatase YigB (HAD superfamily)